MSTIITVSEVRGHCGAGHKVGDQFVFEQNEYGKICPYAWNALFPFLLALHYGVTFPWKYEGSKWEKKEQGVEFVRCPDPVNRVVFQIQNRSNT